MFGRVVMLGTLALLAGRFAGSLLASPAMAVPNGFSDTRVTDVPAPSALDFTPDGRMLVTSKSGRLYTFDQGGNRLADPALDLGSDICTNSERGLLGVAVDPNFGTEGNNYVYVYYTYKKHGVCPIKEPGNSKNPVNRVSRFVMTGDTLDESSEQVLINNIHSPNGNHNGGDLKFGKDGKLYVSVGDGGCDYRKPNRCQYQNGASRSQNVLLGKILRINSDGSVPTDNPYADLEDSVRCGEGGSAAAGMKCEETFLRGFRNPFRFAVDPDADGTVLRINDVGGQRWEEIDQAKVGEDGGNDYGWNVCEGRHDNPYRSGKVNCSTRFTPPIHEYSHSRTGCESITGGAFVPDEAKWPTEYDNSYLFGDFVCGKVFSLKLKDGGGFEREVFAGGLGRRSAVAMAFGPNETTGKALYYATFADGGEIWRIAYNDGDQPPTADIKATPPHGTDANDLTIDFDASGSRDPGGDTSLIYEWNFGDGTTKTTITPTTDYAYAERGEYEVTLTVRDSADKVSEPARINVFPGDTPPEPVIENPDGETTFRVGQEITATGSATDNEGDPVTLRWQVLRYHDGNHSHPWDDGTESELAFSARFPRSTQRRTKPAVRALQKQISVTPTSTTGAPSLSSKIKTFLNYVI